MADFFTETMSPKEHVEEIRRRKFSIGGEKIFVMKDLHRAVKNLSAELYAKDVHFFMELIQNAEDNQYSERVEPSLEFVFTAQDITGTGAPATLLIFNNEVGFSPSNIESICSVGCSTKEGNREKGYIGEKGIGFKSVFLITSRPYIFSNGYQICFNEEPCPHTGLGYIVPEWVDQNPTLAQIKRIYGSDSSSFPTTTLVLPLKPDKVNAVKQQLSVVHPQVLLFLSKIKRLSVKEHNADPRLNTVNAIAITKKTEYVQRKNIDAESFTLHLSADENGSDQNCSFYMWKQKFAVTQAHRSERRSKIDDWTITLAFPLGEPIQRGSSESPGIYAFLPTEMVTNFPFVIQADFLLSSSRETILLDEKWNQGILGCVSTAFVDAFKSFVKTNQDVPVWTLPELFRFLPVKPSNYEELNAVRASIKAKLVEEEIVPSEVLTQQKFFHKPRDVGRLIPSFWSVLSKAKKEGVSLSGLCSHGKFVLASCFDSGEYDEILGFLGVQEMDFEWYGKCIQGSSLVEGVSETIYVELLLFVADNWSSKLNSTNLKHIPLLKYENLNGRTTLTSVSVLAQNDKSLVYLSKLSQQVSWLIEWSKELDSAAKGFFMPEVTQEALKSSPKEAILTKWLRSYAKVGVVDAYDFANLLCNSLTQSKVVISYAHFLYHSLAKGFLSETQVTDLCSVMPFVDNYGRIATKRSGVILPSKASKWAGLVASNLWSSLGFIELSGDYLSISRLGGKLITSENGLLSFLIERVKATDVPYISPPNAPVPSVTASLTKANAFLLLDWIRKLRNQGTRLPEKFLQSIMEGSWLKIKLKGCSGDRPPSQSFLLNSSNSWVNLLQNGSVLVDIPLVDVGYYGNKIEDYIVELKKIGVKTEYAEACEFIGKRLMSLASSGNLTRENVLSILGFISFLRSECLPTKEFVASVKGGKWLRTNLGDKSPSETVWFDESWRVASQISDIPFIDRNYYGAEINKYKEELELLGVVVSFNGSHKLVVDHLKSSKLTCLTSGSLFLLFECMKSCGSSGKTVIKRALGSTRCLKTESDHKLPSGCVLCDPKWDCLLQVFTGLPLVDQSFYGNRIFDYKNELKQIGVVVDFDQAVKVFDRCFRVEASRKSISSANVLSLISSYRQLKSSHIFPSDLNDSITKVKWLRTRHCDYYKSPKECILYSSEFEAISSVARLPFIDDSGNWYGEEIHEYKKELKAIGVVVDFKDAVKFVASGLYFHNVKSITRENALSLLECIKLLSENAWYKFPKDFVKTLSQPWLKTYVGYRSPSDCLLFDSKFADSGLKKNDGPFLDEEFYGSKLASYRKVLSIIAVVVEVEKGCPLISNQLEFHTELSTIVRLYEYLGRFNWEPENDSQRRIWIPNGSHEGDWVSPEACVVSDKSELFGSQLYILDKYYGQNLFFFARAFKVKPSPCTEDYCKLWKSWEDSGRVLSHEECSKFWTYITKHWTSKTEKTLPDELAKVPVKSSTNGIILVNKNDVFIADDLQLKDLFDKSSSRSIFVWYPQPSSPSLSRTALLNVFQKIGVRKISASVEREEVSIPNSDEEYQKVVPNHSLIGKGLVKLIIGFLANPCIGMEPKERHKALEALLNLTVVETAEPINVSYSLSLSSGEILKVKASRTVRWERESLKIFVQKTDDSSKGPRDLIERATYFAEVIAEGVLWENGDHIHELAELIKLAFLLNFDEAAIEFLMKSQNLEIFVEDETFLSSAFPTTD